jgi:PmbA protein
MRRAAAALLRVTSPTSSSPPWPISPEAVERARAARQPGCARQAAQQLEGATLTSHRGVHVYGNSHGFLAGFTSTSHSLSCALLAESGGEMQRDYWYSLARDPAALESASAVGRRAAQRTLARLGSRRLGTRKAPVLFAPEMARGLLGAFVGAIRGVSQYRRASFLLGAAGQQVLPAFLQLSERPPQGALASAPFARGAATRPRAGCNGVLQGYAGSYSRASKLTPPATPAASTTCW